MIKKLKKNKKGFTLVEMIVVIALVAIFGSIVIAVSVSSGKLFGMVQKTSIINDDARIIISDIEDELRFAKNIKETSAGSTDTINYDGGTYTIPVSSNIVLVYKVKENNSDVIYSYARNDSSKEVIKYKLASGIGIPVGISASNVTNFEVIKDPSNKIYNLKMKIDDGKNSASYEASITPRN